MLLPSTVRRKQGQAKLIMSPKPHITTIAFFYHLFYSNRVKAAYRLPYLRKFTVLFVGDLLRAALVDLNAVGFKIKQHVTK